VRQSISQVNVSAGVAFAFASWSNPEQTNDEFKQYSLVMSAYLYWQFVTQLLFSMYKPSEQTIYLTHCHISELGTSYNS